MDNQERKIYLKELNRKKRWEVFLENASRLYFNRFEYDYDSFINAREDINIKEIETGYEFKQSPYKHLTNLPRELAIKDDRKRRALEFYEKALELYGDRFTYDLDKYVNNYTPIPMYCSVHGEFRQKPGQFLLGHSCQACGNIQKGIKKSSKDKTPFTKISDERNLEIKKESLKKRWESIHTNLSLDFSNYVNADSLIGVTCPIHGYSEITYKYIRNNTCCIECGNENSRRLNTLTQEEFLERVIPLHPYLDFSKVEYVDSWTPITVIYEGKEYDRIPYVLSRGGFSVSENTLTCYEQYIFNFISSFYKGEVILNKFYDFLRLPTTKRPCQLDIYFPELKLAIEFNGSHVHHSSVGVSDYLDTTRKSSVYHKWKYLRCKESGIDLIHIFSFEDLDIWLEQIKNYILNPSSYSIVFKNDKRIFNNLEYYGISHIVKNK